MAIYSIITPPLGGILDLLTLKKFLRLDESNTGEDLLLSLIMSSVQSSLEHYTGLVLQPTTFKTVVMASRHYVIKIYKSPVIEILSVKIDAQESEINATIGYNASVFAYGGDVEIVFKAGLEVVPSDLVLAMYQHCAFDHENRGDCLIASDGFPKQIRAIYNLYKVLWI